MYCRSHCGWCLRMKILSLTRFKSFSSAEMTCDKTSSHYRCSPLWIEYVNTFTHLYRPILTALHSSGKKLA